MKASDTLVRSVAVMTPDLANPSGHIHGGHVIFLANNLAWVCATRFARVPCITAAVERVDLVSPISIGDFLDMTARVVWAGAHSIDVEVDVAAENPLTGEERLTETCAFTFAVLRDENGDHPEIPELILDSREAKIAAIRACECREMGRQMSKAVRGDDGLDAASDEEIEARLASINSAPVRGTT